VSAGAAVEIVFDIGNVLLDWRPTQLVQTHFARFLPDGMSADTFAQRLVHADWVAFDNGDIDIATLATRLSAQLKCDETALGDFIAYIPEVLPLLSESVDAMHELFDARDHGEPLRVFFLSNMPIYFAERLEKRFDWFTRFDGGIFSGRENLSKPDPAIYAALESRYALNREHVLFLDDSLPNIRAANARSWQTVHVASPGDVARGLQAHRSRLQ
jgi:putative hydrolase of the HAD superfamily